MVNVKRKGRALSNKEIQQVFRNEFYPIDSLKYFGEYSKTLYVNLDDALRNFDLQVKNGTTSFSFDEIRDTLTDLSEEV